MGSRVHHHRSLFANLFPAMTRDYITRRRRTRTISNVLLIVLFSILLAGMVLYTSNPASFGVVGK